MDQTHGSRIEAAFTKQAGTFAQPELNVAFTSGLPWLLDLVAARADDRVLDVAGGTGLVARALAPSVRSVTVLDATDAMLAAGREGAAGEGLDNVEFVKGDAASLPFDDGSFSLVVTRFSLHHFADPAPMLDEIVRVTAPGGRVVVKDLVSSAEPGLAAGQDEVERLRDDSHVSMPVENMVRVWLQARGCEVEQVARKTVDRPLEPWLAQSLTPDAPADAVRSLLADEVAGGRVTGMRPHLQDGALWFHQTWETTVARRL
ncbi:MAG TPA: methyltransferase domain-containing protein [Nocardioidaceae bacterium]|nr:methyltransferase domain-containing protein [Nocardioidaceae bacterium]